MKLILCDGDWQHTGSGWDCSGAVTQIVHSAPVEYTAQMAMEAIFQGFSVTLPVFAVIFGGRLLLKTLLNRGM